MKKKLITMLLVGSMMFSALAGCGNKESAKSSEVVEKSSTQTASVQESTVEPEGIANFNEEGYPIVNEEITLKILYCARNTDSMVPPEEFPAIKRLDEQTGIKTEWEVVKESDWSTELNLTFASGEYPDVIIAVGDGKVDFEEYGVEQGIVIPMDDLIEQYMPLYNERKAELEMDPTIPFIASDGQRYTAGYLFGDLFATDNHYFINEAWLKALNLEMPNDIESLTEVLRAFKTKDPNGNGEADEIPIVARMTEVGYFAQLFGVPKYSKWMFIDDNKQVQSVPAQEGFRKLMEWAHMCYKEGLLDPEVLTQDNNTVKAKLADGDAGFFLKYRLGHSGYTESEKTCTLYTPSSEEAVLPKNFTIASSCAYITKTNEHPEATARWLNALLEVDTAFSLYHGEKGNQEFGWDYTADGKIELLGTAPETSMTYFGSSFFRFFPDDMMVDAEKDVEKKGYCDIYEDAGLLQKYSDLYFLWCDFSGEENDKKTEVEANLKNVMNEYMAAFITDGVTDDKWNEFQSVLDNIGMKDYIQMYQKAIDVLDVK